MIQIKSAYETITKMNDSSKEAFYLSYPEMKDYDIENLNKRTLPARATKNAAAYDLSAPYTFTIGPGEEKRIFLGWEVSSDLPEIGAILAPRSSLCKKKGLITVYKCDRVSDGMISTVLKNLTDKSVTVEAEERILQIFFTEENFRPTVFDGSQVQVVSTKKAEMEGLVLPKTASDFFLFQAPEDVVIPPSEVVYIMTNIKWQLDSNKVLILNLDTNLSGVALANGIGVVDADYYNNPDNEGNIGFAILNVASLPITIRKGTVLGMGSVHNIYVTDDDITGGERKGGFGSTGET